MNWGRIWRLLAGLVLASALAGCDSNYEPPAAVQAHLKSSGFLPYQGKGYVCPKEKCGTDLLMVYFTGEANDLGDELYSAQNEIVSRRLNRDALKMRILNSLKTKELTENIQIISLDHKNSTVLLSGKFKENQSGFFFRAKVRVVNNSIFMSGLAGHDKRLVAKYFSARILD